MKTLSADFSCIVEKIDWNLYKYNGNSQHDLVLETEVKIRYVESHYCIRCHGTARGSDENSRR